MMEIPRGPVLVLKEQTKREVGFKVQRGNVQAAKNIADVVRSCLGPRSMLKMLLDPMGGIVMTNDGNAILREITVEHPAAKTLIEVSRTQDEEVGDGTTSVVILAGEMMNVAEPFLNQQMHPTVVISAFRKALDDILSEVKEKLSVPIDMKDQAMLLKIIESSVQTKFIGGWGKMACQMALDAVKTVLVEGNGRREIDIKRYVKVEMVPGGSIEESRVLSGVMLNKDVTHSKMRRRIEKPRIILLDCSLEYKKGESQTDLELSKDIDFNRILQLEEEYVKEQCGHIIALKPDVVITEKGLSDLASHFLVKNNISALRRTRKSDNNRIARAVGATIVNRPDELREEDVGKGCGLFEITKIGDEYYAYLIECQNPKACTLLLRGSSKDVLKEVDRNLNDAMNVARNVLIDPRMVPGGGATEMALSCALTEKAKSVSGVHQWPYQAVAKALEIIPQTLIQNCGGNTIRTLTALRAKHAVGGNSSWGIDGVKGMIVDMNDLGVWDPLSVKLQSYKTAIETAILLLRIDDIVSGTKKASEKSSTDSKQDNKEEEPPKDADK
ncbi:T-complex protein 1 subunit gamma-like [Corticium candelabrum]|uniref:T-complex protein 1 subunit gamma-like n=1 Tax=Corticium candelabrum TaxID=121492 RepID=UPI002E27230A|nr:T-complex protein 1 subunit gamma-like [Corticium candelabrum]